MNRLTEKDFTLLYGSDRLSPVSLDRNAIGFCAICGSDLESLTYYSTGSEWLVAAQCKKEHLALIRYDQEWNWQGDLELELYSEEVIVASLPREKLDSVFTAAEIRDMIACQQGKPYTRQNIYRARAKYDKFEKLFGIRINI